MAARKANDGRAERPKGSGSIRPIGERPRAGKAGKWELRVNLATDPVTGKRTAGPTTRSPSRAGRFASGPTGASA